MLPYQQRVVEEQHLLQSKTGLLRTWLDSREPQHLTVDERLLMELQCNVMELYSDILRRRISLFKETT